MHLDNKWHYTDNYIAYSNIGGSHIIAKEAVFIDFNSEVSLNYLNPKIVVSVKIHLISSHNLKPNTDTMVDIYARKLKQNYSS